MLVFGQISQITKLRVTCFCMNSKNSTSKIGEMSKLDRSVWCLCIHMPKELDVIPFNVFFLAISLASRNYDLKNSDPTLLYSLDHRCGLARALSVLKILPDIIHK